MNKPAKKPAVAAKTVAKKRGRPAGKKNAPKKIVMSYEAAVDWEALAKNLQQALAGEMKDNEMLEELLQHYNDEAMRVRTFWERCVTFVTGRV